VGLMELFRDFPTEKTRHSAMSIATELEEEHRIRLRRYKKHWNFYEGKHWTYATPTDDPVVTVNYCKKFANKHTNFTFGKGFKLVVPDDPSTDVNEEAEREFVRQKLERIWSLNDKNLWAWKAGQMGSVTGDLFVRVSWEEDDDTAAVSYPKAEILHSKQVFPVFSGPAGNPNSKMENVTIVYPEYKDAPTRAGSAKKGNKVVQLVIETWYPDKVLIWDGNELTERKNVLGEIPLVHVPNVPSGTSHYGDSDIELVEELNREYNEKMTDVSDVINYQGSPVTIVKGAKLGQVERGANRMWTMPMDSSVENLALDGELGTSLTYLDRLRDHLHEIGDVPPAAMGGGGKESAVALAMRFLPMYERRNLKILTYGIGLCKVNRLMLKFEALMNTTFRRKMVKLPKENRYRTQVTFPDPLPRDELMELEKAGKRLDLGLSTREEEMENMGKSQAEVTRTMKVGEEELVRRAQLEMNIGQELMPDKEQANRGGNPNPTRPEPTVQGEKRSIAAQRDLA